MSDEQMLYAVVVLVAMLGYFIMSYFLYKSTPPQTPEEKQKRQDEMIAKFEAILDRAEALAKATPSKLDDMAVEAARKGVEAYEMTNILPEPTPEASPEKKA